MKKYKIIEETERINSHGATVYRIVALKNVGHDVKKGDIGGWIANESNLSHYDECWVYDEAEVFGNAKITWDAQIRDHSKIKDNAIIYGYAIIEEYAEISGNAQIGDNVIVCGRAQVWENVVLWDVVGVSGNAIIRGNAQIRGTGEIKGNARIGGNVQITGWPVIKGNARIEGHAKIGGSAIISNYVGGYSIVTHGEVIESPSKYFGSAFDYEITITDNHIQIGREVHTKKEWANFTDKQILKMDGTRALTFWKMFKPLLIAMGEIKEIIKENEKE